MPYQNDSVTSKNLVLGNCKVEAALSALGDWSNLGAGMVSIWAHDVVKFSTQAGNAPDPLSGISSEVIKVDFELIEFDASVLTTIHGGLITASTVSSVITISAGGHDDNTISERAFRFTNKRTISGNSVNTILTVFHATMDTGPRFAWKSDNDEDPIMVMANSITGEVDTSRTQGVQLYTLSHALP